MHSANLLGKQMDTVYGLYLPEYSIPTPEVQTDYVEVPGKDGSIDKTAPDGVVRFRDREWSLEFQKTGASVSAYDLPAISRQLYSDLHGRKGNIIFDDDTSYKWVGRVFVDDVRCESNGLIIAAISLITDPYRYKITDIQRTFTLSSTEQEITLVNGRKPIVPVITISGDNASATLEFTIKGEDYTTTLGAGTWTVSDLVLFEGNTNITISGSGSIVFVYPEATL